jgi:DnaJ-class molecular chaperone
VRPHPTFQREGDNLRTDVSVPLTTAILGGEARVPTLKSEVALTIPPETQNGRIFRLAGLGMPKRANPSQRGDLYAVVSIVLPEQLSDQERQLFKQLQELRPGA